MTGMDAYHTLKATFAAAVMVALAGCSSFSLLEPDAPAHAAQPVTQGPMPGHPQAAYPAPQPVQQQAPVAHQTQAAPYQRAAAGGPAPVSAPASAISQYRLDAGDELRVIVFGQEQLSGTFRVDDAGAITMPLLPPVGVRGLTTLQTKATIEQALAQTLLRNPNVSVEVSSFRPFFILGEVNQPGQYPYVANMTVETAVAIAGGYTYRANTSTVRITRPSQAEFKAPPETSVMPGDTIFIRERFF